MGGGTAPPPPGMFTVGYPSMLYVCYNQVGASTCSRSDNGGQSWSTVSPPTDSEIQSLAAVGSDRLYVLASDGTIQRSDNGGASYSLLNPGTFHPAAIAASSQAIIR